MLDDSTGQHFYLIPSLDGVNSFIIAELNTEFESTLKDKNISQFFTELYHVYLKINFYIEIIKYQKRKIPRHNLASFI